MKIVAKLPSVEELKKEMGLSAKIAKSKSQSDDEIAAILRGEDNRILLIVGPCSADDLLAVLEYAGKLARIAENVRERICIVMRVFTAKPRTACSGYMGLMHEENGIEAARRLHLDVRIQTGLPTADELLYPATLPYFDDIVSYFTIGARSSENQEHRLVASGIKVPIGMKNPLSGDLQAMANAISAAKAPHDFIFGGNVVRSEGNPLAHGILRGGDMPNYQEEILHKLNEMGILPLIVDTNHANSGKDHMRQPQIALGVLKNRSLIKGLMIESYIADGAAKPGMQVFGQSITDPCLGIDATEKLVYEIADRI